MGQGNSKIDGNFSRIANKPAQAWKRTVNTIANTPTLVAAKIREENDYQKQFNKGSGAKAAVGKVLLAGVATAAIVGTTVAITKFSGTILSSVGGLGAHGGIIVGVFVGIAFLLTGILSAVAIMKKQKQIKNLRSELNAAVTVGAEAGQAFRAEQQENQKLVEENASLKTTVGNREKLVQSYHDRNEQLQQELRAPQYRSPFPSDAASEERSYFAVATARN